MIGLQDIAAARGRLRGVAFHTPLVPCPGGEEGRALYFKPESLQPTGAFKLRGAYNKISSLSQEERSRGVVAHSSGNHARAVAYAIDMREADLLQHIRHDRAHRRIIVNHQHRCRQVNGHCMRSHRSVLAAGLEFRVKGQRVGVHNFASNHGAMLYTRRVSVTCHYA